MADSIAVLGSLNMDFVVRVAHLPAPGETVLPHRPDRNLSVHEVAGIELVEPGTSAVA